MLSFNQLIFFSTLFFISSCNNANEYKRIRGSALGTSYSIIVDTKVKEHCYYPDFYYEMRNSEGVLKQVVVEVKPFKEYKMVQDLNEGNLVVPENGMKKLKNFEYDLKMAYKNKNKWETMINWCNKKGYEFIIITEQHLKKFNL